MPTAKNSPLSGYLRVSSPVAFAFESLRNYLTGRLLFLNRERSSGRSTTQGGRSWFENLPFYFVFGRCVAVLWHLITLSNLKSDCKYFSSFGKYLASYRFTKSTVILQITSFGLQQISNFSDTTFAIRVIYIIIIISIFLLIN